MNVGVKGNHIMNEIPYVEERSHKEFGSSDLSITAHAEHPHNQPNRIVVLECLLPTNRQFLFN